MLEIRDLHVSIDDTEILKGISLTVNEVRGTRGHGAERLG